MKYNHFDMLPEEAFKRDARGMIKPQGGASGSGVPTQRNGFAKAWTGYGAL
jgi:hypothetical protein